MKRDKRLHIKSAITARFDVLLKEREVLIPLIVCGVFDLRVIEVHEEDTQPQGPR